jgi:hypothetical protein
MLDQLSQSFGAGLFTFGTHDPMCCGPAIPGSLGLKELPGCGVLAERRLHLIVEGALAVLI